MFGDPRCREWTPLATQQLRLRSLIQIVGYNIRPPERVPGPSSYYFTLHATTMSAPFHTSERVASLHPKWREIDSEIIQRMSSQNVVVRIWCHSINAPTPDAHTPPPTDKIIQTWGIYFSGLLHIGANLAIDFTADSFKQNTLVFQMHGGYFCSYKSLRLDAVNLTNSQPTSSSSSAETNKSPMIPIEARFMQSHYRFTNPTKESKSMSPNKNTYYKNNADFVSKSQSPPSSGGFRQSFAKIRSTGSLNINQNRTRSSRVEEDCSLIFEHSPKDSSDLFTCDSHDKLVSLSREDLSKSNIDLSESADLYIKGNDDMPIAKCRYSSLNFLKSEIRPSYNSLKLQKLHLLQFSIKKRKEAVEEIKRRIYQKSAMDGMDQYGPSNIISEGSEQIRCKSRMQKGLFEDDYDKDKDSDSNKGLGVKSPSKNGKIPASDVHFAPNDRRFTLSLNKLLEFKTRPSPHQCWEHTRLSRQLEVLRFKRLLLAGERDTKHAGIRRLKELRAALYERNQDNGTELMQNYHALSRSWECLREAGQSAAALRELASRSHQALHVRRHILLGQLHRYIFTIEKVRSDYYTISGCGLTVCGDGKPGGVSASREAAGAGLAAQCCCVAARILQQPLRYQVKLHGSMSYIVDHLTPQLVDRNIPLYPRERDCALFRYALFLLNVTVAQLLWGVGAAAPDVRATLRNLHALLTREHTGASDGHSLLDASKMFGSASSMEGAYGGGAPSHCSVVPQNLRSLVAYKADRRQFNRFKDCVDNNSSMSVHIMKHRHSRSVGSYKDDKDHQTLEISSSSIMGSEPSLLILDEAICTSGEVLDLNPSRLSLKPHCSESEISRLSDSCYDNPVIFSLPDDDGNTDQLILKMSSNNDDSVTEENFEAICTRIEELCDHRKESNTDIMVTNEKENSNEEETLSNGNEDAVLHVESSDFCNDKS